MSERESVLQSLRAVEASLSVLIVARDTLMKTLEELPPEQPPAPAGDGLEPCGHPAEKCLDVGVGDGSMVCECGETVRWDG